MNTCDVIRWTKRWMERATESVEARLGDAPRSRQSRSQWLAFIDYCNKTMAKPLK